ncbi:protein VASCULAR ASSOCIATED DEATH 1 [Cucumis melo var. makuwa]|uniref:Protein VASCULAR ASSOCIATED DEATH 1 n=1 Tax=Cucumis melo var. makuwa TaxID=1194695 RepID=A0A5D3DB49_CUCMM|nr:protein VASCULAR ASSOCIATED DEATH 1 [Cucumis melo var. makuwa]
MLQLREGISLSSPCSTLCLIGPIIHVKEETMKKMEKMFLESLGDRTGVHCHAIVQLCSKSRDTILDNYLWLDLIPLLGQDLEHWKRGALQGGVKRGNWQCEVGRFQSWEWQKSVEYCGLSCTGKIVQSTLEECREAYGLWIQMAKELLKQKLTGSEEGTSGSTSQSGKDHHIEKERNNNKSLEKSNEKNDQRRSTASQYSTDVDQQAKNSIQGVNSTSAASWLREYIKKLWIVLRSQNYLPLALVITFAVIFFMQLSIVMLLSRPQHIHVSSPDYGRGLKFSGGRSSDATAWLEKRMHHLKDEMYMVEARLEMMRREHAQLKAQLRELEELS